LIPRAFIFFVAIFELGVEEIMVIAHSDCGACHMHSEEMLEKMKAHLKGSKDGVQ